ncbi:MAG TPA: chemotaxis protein CheW [Gallionellaceae bacterium]
MSGTKAWLLDLGASNRAAVGVRELLHLIDAPRTHEIPCTPAYCRHAVLWQDRLLPVMDMAGRLGGELQTGSLLAVVGYQQVRGELPRFGALMLASPPRQVEVSNEQACDLPEEAQRWKSLAISCFDYQGDAVPVLNLGRIFDAPAP